MGGFMRFVTTPAPYCHLLADIAAHLARLQAINDAVVNLMDQISRPDDSAAMKWYTVEKPLILRGIMELQQRRFLCLAEHLRLKARATKLEHEAKHVKKTRLRKMGKVASVLGNDVVGRAAKAIEQSTELVEEGRRGMARCLGKYNRN